MTFSIFYYEKHHMTGFFDLLSNYVLNLLLAFFTSSNSGRFFEQLLYCLNEKSVGFGVYGRQDPADDDEPAQ
ncbi:MAG: hypothetical protein WAV86_12810 [Lutibacter sp.]